MGNSFKLTKWIVIGVVVLLIITIGMAVIRGFDSFMKEDSDKLEIIDSTELNNKLAPYKGKMSGTKLRQMFDFLIKNAEANEKNPELLPDVAYQIADGDDFQIIYSTVYDLKVKEMKSISMKFDSTYNYSVDFIYSDDDIISGIIIKYNEKNKYTFTPDET